MQSAFKLIPATFSTKQGTTLSFFEKLEHATNDYHNPNEHQYSSNKTEPTYGITCQQTEKIACTKPENNSRNSITDFIQWFVNDKFKCQNKNLEGAEY